MTTDVPASLAPVKRLDWLDAFRGWAVLGVVVVHSGLLVHVTGLTAKITSTGQYGVQLFFFVSAITISLTYESHIRQFGRSVQSQFAWLIKRFFRIAPLYYFAAIFYPIEQYAIYRATHHVNGSTTTVPNIIANLLFVHTWIPAANNSVVQGGWSIGVEMFFYLLVPFVWMVAPARRRVVVLGVSAVAFLLVTEVTSKLTSGSFFVEDNTYLYFWFPTQAPVIVVGLIFYLVYGPRLHQPRSAAVAAVCLSGFLVCLLTAFYCGTGADLAPQLAPTIVGIALILFVIGLQGWAKKVVVNRAAVALGEGQLQRLHLPLRCTDFASHRAKSCPPGPSEFIRGDSGYRSHPCNNEHDCDRQQAVDRGPIHRIRSQTQHFPCGEAPGLRDLC